MPAPVNWTGRQTPHRYDLIVRFLKWTTMTDSNHNAGRSFSKSL
jgi:hypothetical protein